MDIKGLDKATVLAALYNHAKPQGMGFLHYDPTSMTVEQARVIIEERGDDLTAMFGKVAHGGNSLYFDYLKGHVMKVELSKDELDTRLYNRDNGPGAAEKAILEELTRPS